MAKVAKSVAGTAAPASSSAPSETFKYKFTPEDADSRIAEIIPENFSNELGDSAWKVRLATLEESFPQWLEGSLDTVDAELVFRFLGKKPGWNEKNFQVSTTNAISNISPLYSSSSFTGIGKSLWHHDNHCRAFTVI